MVVITIENKKTYTRLIEEMESLKGYEIIQGIGLLKDTNYIFTQNYLELINKIEIYEKDPEIWVRINEQKLHFIILETRRLLHNYSASVLTLIDHTSNFRKKISDKKIDNIYEKKVSRLNKHDVVIFMKHFRQYLQHYSLPIVSASFNASFNTDQLGSEMDKLLNWLTGEIKDSEGIENRYMIEKKMYLDINELLEWKGWNSRSKDYLDEFGDKVEIKIFCEEYFHLIESFYDSFYNVVLEECKNEIIELEKFKNYVIEIYPSQEHFVRNLP